jgi:hypothetical protein
LIRVIKLSLQRSEEAFHDGIAAEHPDTPICGIASSARGLPRLVLL